MITASELAKLEDQRDTYREHSNMLGRVGSLVSDFCKENETVEVGVARLLAEYHDLKAQSYWDRIETIKSNDPFQ